MAIQVSYNQQMAQAARQLTLFDAPVARSLPAEPDAPFAFTVRQSARAKRLSIKVYPGGRVVVVAPRRARPKEVQAFIAESRDWIERSVAALATDTSAQDSGLPSRIELPAVEQAVVVSYRRPEAVASVRCRERGQTLVLSGATDNEELCRQALRRWLAKRARKEFAPRIEALADEFGLPFERLQIRAQRTCWGSRSSTGTLSLNLCLLFVEPEVLRYLFVHELCHGRHMNHSRAFWRLVARHEPHYRRLDRALSESWKAVPGWLDIY